MERAARLSDVCHRWHVITAEHHIQHIFHTAIGSREKIIYVFFFISGSQTLVKKCPYIGNKVVCQAEGKAESRRTDMVEILEKTCNCFQSFACASVSKLNQLKPLFVFWDPLEELWKMKKAQQSLHWTLFRAAPKVERLIRPLSPSLFAVVGC